MKRKVFYVGMMFTLLLGSFPVTIFGETVTSSSESEVDVIKETLESTYFESYEENDELTEFPIESSETVIEETEETLELIEETEPTSEVIEEETESSIVEETIETEYLEEFDDFSPMDEALAYPSQRSDLSVGFQTFATFSTIPSVKATDTNVPQKSFIDVSSHNGNLTVDNYKTIKSYGVEGVVVKLTEATSYKNPYAKDQVKNAIAAGLKVSVYHYSWFTDKDSARKEADYFANMAEELGLPKDTVMVNDIEEPQIANNKNHTSNSLEFEKRLNERGFKNVNHYIGLYWITDKRIDAAALGNKKVWVAAYPYILSNEARYTEYGAWQWSARLTFPGISGEFDISADYAKNYTSSDSNDATNSEGIGYGYGKYVTVQNMRYAIWNNLSWDKKIDLSQHHKKTYLAKEYFNHSNGSRYLSLYDNNNKLVGYINEKGTSLGTGKQGKYQNYGKYVTIQNMRYAIWRGFSFTSQETLSQHHKNTYLAKGYYTHFNGQKFLSIYDNSGKWIGYINEKGTSLGTGKQGKYQNYGKHVTIQNMRYAIWRGFSFTKKENLNLHYGKSYLAKGFYTHFNGKKFLSIYDNSGKWIGYINEDGTK
jgi:hypothetical protein